MKHLKKELNQLNFTKPIDIFKQTLFVIGIIILSGTILSLFDTSIQTIISLLV